MPTAEQLFTQAASLRKAGDLPGAERLLRQLLEEQPDTPPAAATLGQILLEQGRPQDAVDLLRPYADDPADRPMVRFTLGLALNRVGRPTEGLEHLERAALVRPKDPEIRFYLGATLERLARHDEAGEAFRSLMDLFAQTPQDLVTLGQRLLRIGRPDLASESLDRAISGGRQDAQTLLLGADAHQRNRNSARAIELARKSVAASPSLAGPHLSLADLLERRGDLDEAHACASEALRLAPDLTPAARILARIERRRGNSEQSDRIIRRALARPPSDPRLLGPLLIEHAHALDDLGRYDEAFEVITRGKAVWFESVRGQFPLERFEQELDRRQRAIDSMSPPATDAGDERSPVFFVGFPRSGTTLMEQILAAHPRAVSLDEVDLLENVVLPAAREMLALPALERTGAPGVEEGEIIARLNDEQVAELRTHYWSGAERALGAAIGERLLIDKLPLNITRLALIQRVFPRARVLVALRDPRDCCLSALFQSFDANDAMVHFHAIEPAARLYARVMGIWLRARERIGVASHEYRYEDLTADVEAALRPILEFLALAWDDGLLSHQRRVRDRALSTPSYERVDRPIDRKGVARWRHYERHLAPVLPILAPFVEAFGYEP